MVGQSCQRTPTGARQPRLPGLRSVAMTMDDVRGLLGDIVNLLATGAEPLPQRLHQAKLMSSLDFAVHHLEDGPADLLGPLKEVQALLSRAEFDAMTPEEGTRIAQRLVDLDVRVRNRFP